MSLSKMCEEVMDACLSNDPRRTTGIGGDNMTCIVVLVRALAGLAERGESSAVRGEAGWRGGVIAAQML